MYDDLKGKIALISGSGKKTGLGFAIAEKLADNGAHICISDLPGLEQDMLERTDDLRKKYNVETMIAPLDVTSTHSVDDAHRLVREHFGGLDVLVNNAGAVFGAPSPIMTYDEEGWMKTIDVNLHSVFRLSKKFLPDIIQRKGSIVNIASTAGKGAHALAGPYSCAKTGVIMLTKVMAKEVGAHGVRVNAICPGLIMTDLQTMRINLEAKVYDCTPEERESQMKATVPLHRIGDPSEVAALAVFLLSKESSYITGQAINVCGGRTMEL
jgi:NAD(P)-dependent dehydrogenase (short-subunit alcohol dehydrogenase family)